MTDDTPRRPAGRRSPITFGHRGARAYAPENSIEGFRLALAQGVTGLESDAWLAGDGVPVLVHDETIRTSRGRIRVTRRPASELATLGIPSLAAIYEACGTAFELSLDVKDHAVGEPVLDVAEAAGATGHLWLCLEDIDALVALRAASPVVGLVHSPPFRAIRGPFEAHVARLAGIRTDVLNLRWRSWTVERIDATHRHGLLAFAWDTDDPATFHHLLDMGIDGIYSDYPDRLADAVSAYRPPHAHVSGRPRRGGGPS